MSDLRERQLRMAAARADFLEYGPAGAAGVDDVVAASWERSRSAGVDADAYQVAFHDDIDFDSRLARCAAPVIGRLTQDMSDVPVTIALTDAQARIVDRRDCSTAVGRVLDRVDFQRGFSFEESSCGTNGVGTVFEVGAPISVVGCEHFNQTLIQFACTGAPIFDPLTGRVAGVLDASMLADSWNPLVDALVRSAADDIGRNLFLDRGQATRALFESYLRADARTRQAVMAIGAGVHGPRGVDTVMANELARELLSPNDRDTITQFAQFTMSAQERAAGSLTLADGRRIRLRTRLINCNSETIGMVIVLAEDSTDGTSDEIVAVGPAIAKSATLSHYPIGHAHARVGQPKPAHAVATRASRVSRAPGNDGSPTWRRARRDALAAWDSNGCPLVVGESGSGRLSLVAETFRESFGTAPVVVVDAERVQQGNQVTRPDAHTSGPALLIVRHLDKCGAATIDTLCAMTDAARRAGYLVAATAEQPTGSNDTATYAPMLSRLNQTITVPPLRLRTADLESIVGRILKDLAPHRNTRISPNAMRVLTTFAWPGNIRQLRSALEEALRRRPVGEVQPEDLPGYCRSTPARTLTTIESAERDAIVAALAESGGNRVKAAASLGLSRSSLYRKLASYGISGI